jgi:hypothetical protein
MLQKVLAQFIPIVLIFVLLSSFRSLVKFSNTVVGKLVAVFIIIFYTYLDKILGVFVCAITIFYYQSDVVENMLNMDNDLNDSSETVIENNTEMNMEESAVDSDVVDDYDYLSNDKKKKENMTSYSDVYNKETPLLNNEKLENAFRKNSCVNGQLTNKGLKVKYEMIEHVFPELKFRKAVCNPCLKSCDFSIIESKIDTEKKLKGV